ncbi:hypothetical protein ACIQVK_48720 [Streptomyces sp. NPDC090493]|uniref:hypothetical protein n=1 Tax=Streptomyces sp. NPDC090493 TaxID=3365964 RepID=UPI0037FF29E8
MAGPAAMFPVIVVADLIGLTEEARGPLLSFADAVPENLRPDGWAAAIHQAADRGDIEAASVVPLLSFASANRHERKWERPEEFLVRRNPVDHVALGYGVHGCAGQGLARLEAHAVLGALARRVSSIQFADEPVRKLNNVIRGLASLPVTVRTEGQ